MIKRKVITVLLAVVLGVQPLVAHVEANDFDQEQKAVTLSVPKNVKARPNGNGIILIEWDKSALSGADGNISYLVYRSDSIDGVYEKIGFNSKGCFYNDAGENGLEIGKKYYYKIKAYIKTTQEYSSDFSQSATSTVTADNIQNEFMNVTSAVNYLKFHMEQRNAKIEFYLWYDPNKISGFSKELYNQSIVDHENLEISDSAVGGDYLYGHLRGYDCELFDDRVNKNGLSRYKFTYTFQYYNSSEEETLVESEIQSLIRDKLNITDSMNKQEKIRAVYEYLSKNVTYDLSLRNGNRRVAAYDALVLHKSVCQGYANATYRILRSMGINNRIVMGEVLYEGEKRVHAWNIVLIDGKWYNLDCTIGAEVFMANKYFDYRGYLKNEQDFKDYIRYSEYKTSSYVKNHPMTSVSVSEPKDLGQVKISQAELKGNKIYLKWNQLDNARGYNIFRSNRKGGGYTFLTTVMGSNSYIDSSIEIGENYYYKIRPYKKVNGSEIIGDFSNEVEVITLPAPNLSSVKNVGNDRIHLKWNVVNNANGYFVYRYNNDKKKYVKIATTATNEFQDFNLTSGREYSYAVLAYAKGSKSTLYSDFSNERSAKTAESTILKATKAVGSNKVLVEWSSVTGSTGYNLYRADYKASGKFDFKFIKGTTDTSTIDTTAEKGKSYVYQVRPFEKVDGKVYYSDSSNIGIASTLSAKVLNVENLGYGLKINWEGTGTKTYNIYRYSASTGNYVYLKSVANVKHFIDTDAVAGQQYYYKVRPYNKLNNKVYYGDYSNARSGVALQTTTLTIESFNGDRAHLQWASIDSARGYNVYRCDTESGTYHYVTSVIGTSFTVTKNDLNYYYKVRPYKKFDENVYYATYSNPVYVMYK